MSKNKRATVIAIYNNKGGVGKTTFGVNFLHSIVSNIAKEDGGTPKCLMVDNDGQGNSTLILTGKNEDEIVESGVNTMFDMMVDEDLSVKECIVETKYSNIDLICATDDHSDTPDAISSNVDNTRILREKLKEVIYEYDYIVIDCAPTRDRNIYNALFAADVVISPMEAQLFSQIGLRNLLKQVSKVNKKKDNPLLHYVFLNKVDNRQKVNNQKVRNSLADKLDDDFIGAELSMLSLYAKSFEDGCTAINYNDNRGKQEIDRLTKAIINKINEELF